MNDQCRVCGTALGPANYAEGAPSISSMATILQVPLKIFVCRTCAHVQSSELPDLEDFYDKEYRISMTSADHDQLYEVVDGTEVFRTDKQRDMVLATVNLPTGARILDFGAAKAATLRKVLAERTDLLPHVFDVSNDYREHWNGWLKEEQTSSYQLPERWNKTFDAVTAHFVIEHVANPNAMLRDLHRVMKPGAELFLSAPDALSNSGDFLVADHINHFTQPSLTTLLERNGFKLKHLSREQFHGAFVAVAVAQDEIPTDAVSVSDVDQTVENTHCHLKFWQDLGQTCAQIRLDHSQGKAAIYGAGFYGTLLFSRLNDSDIDLLCFIDRNPHIVGSAHLGLPVVAPDAVPDGVEIIFAGLNPSKAREILANVTEWQDRDLRIVYLANENVAQ